MRTVLHIETVPRPAAGRGELLVPVHAAAINALDTQARTGHLLALEETPEAHRQSVTRRTRGKIVLEVRP